MAKDYKNSPKPKDRPKGGQSGGRFPAWGWFLLGLAVCFFAIKGWPFMLQAAQHANKGLVNMPAATTHKAPVAATRITASVATAQPHFDFYRMLPSFQVVIPGQDKDVRSGDDTKAVSQPGSYILQVGSFPTYADADKLKANLALLGIESVIQSVQVNNGSTWNRVRVGPIKDLKELNSMRAKLAQQHIEPLVIKQ